MSNSYLPPSHFCGMLNDSFHSGNSSFGLHSPTNSDIAKCVFIVILTLCIILLNLLMIAVLNSRNHHQYLRRQPRYFMTSLAVTDLAMGTLVTPFCTYPSLFRCWPLGESFCAVESLLISALFHQSTLSLMCVAIDRYIAILHPLRYKVLMTRKVCLSMVTASWMTSFTIYSILIYPHTQFFFDPAGIMSCEPYYANKLIILFAVSIFYAPPVLVIMFCYVSIFFVAQKHLHMVRLPAITASACVRSSVNSKVISKESLKNLQTALTLAAIALGFAIAVSPWTIMELYSSCLETKVSRNVDFITTWIAISNSFWNPVIYGVMNNSFRTVASEILHKVFCLNRLSRSQNRLSQLTLESLVINH